AFERVPQLSKLLDDPNRLQAVLHRHYIPGRVLKTDDLRGMKTLWPHQGEKIEVDVGDKHIELNDAKILVPDMVGANGVVHGIDHVLMRNNDSMLREAGSAVERGLKHAAEKIEDAFDGDDNDE